jgi:uncharacterized protein
MLLAIARRLEHYVILPKRYLTKKITMQKLVLVILTVLSLQLAYAQQPGVQFVNNPYPKTITVSGSAEMEIVPDEIFVNIELKEYQKRGESKKDIEGIKTNFLESCKAVGIADSLISIVAYSGAGPGQSYYHSRKKRKPTDMFASITYQVKFKTSKLMDDLVEKLDDDATANFSISRVSHSKITEFRKQLKIRAIQAAKDKGIYLTEAIGEKLGEAITVNEPDEALTPRFNLGGNALFSNSNYLAIESQTRVDAGEGYSNEVDFKKMKMRFEVSVVFALK